MEKEDLKCFGIGLVAGLLVGSVAALLFAPVSGQEARSVIIP